MSAGAGIAYQDIPEHSRKLSAGTENVFHYCINTIECGTVQLSLLISTLVQEALSDGVFPILSHTMWGRWGGTGI